MHDEPPAVLTDLLSRLRLAKPHEVCAVGQLARGLARGLPLFESVWVDALVQAKLLTPYQACEINAGRGEQLQVGPYLVQSPCGKQLGWAESYVAVHRETKRTAHLLVARGSRAESAARHLQSLVEQSQTLTNPPASAASPEKSTKAKTAASEKSPSSFAIAPLEVAGADGQTLWAAFKPSAGIAAAQWSSWHGRLPPAVVLEIARQMAAALARLETANLSHGDIAASTLMFTEKGEVQLARCGVRGILRPHESESPERLPIEAFDYLPPETISSEVLMAAPANRDMYACGCLWWHLLTGRTPLAGGDHAAKLRAVQAARIPDVRRLAPDVPKILAEAIQRCTQRDPAQRPATFADMAQQLGPSTSAGRRQLADLLARSRRRTAQINWSWRARAGLQRAATQLMATAACLVLLAAATWPLWRTRHSPEHGAASHTPLTKAADTPKLTRLVATAAADPAVRQANYQAADHPAKAHESASPASTAKAPPPVIELEADKEIAGASLRLQPGTIVRGKADQRPRILAPAGGIPVSADNVRFENIDFLWRQRPEGIASAERQAIIDLRGAHAEFVNCTFQAQAGGLADLPVAVQMTGGSPRTSLAPAGQVRLEQCALAHLACGVDLRPAEPRGD